MEKKKKWKSPNAQILPRQTFLVAFSGYLPFLPFSAKSANGHFHAKSKSDRRENFWKLYFLRGNSWNLKFNSHQTHLCPPSSRASEWHFTLTLDCRKSSGTKSKTKVVAISGYPPPLLLHLHNAYAPTTQETTRGVTPWIENALHL